MLDVYPTLPPAVGFTHPIYPSVQLSVGCLQTDVSRGTRTAECEWPTEVFQQMTVLHFVEQTMVWVSLIWLYLATATTRKILFISLARYHVWNTVQLQHRLKEVPGERWGYCLCCCLIDSAWVGILSKEWNFLLTPTSLVLFLSWDLQINCEVAGDTPWWTTSWRHFGVILTE